MPKVPEYITVTDANGVRMAFLSPESDGITDCEIETQLNGLCQITFRLPLTCEKVGELLPERRIIAGGKEFVLLAPAGEERSRTGQALWFRATALESWRPLLSKVYPTVPNDGEPAPVWGTVSILASDLGRGGFSPGSAGSALYRLLEGSGWTVGTVDTSGSLVEMHDLETERLSLLANIQKVQQTWGGYLVWDSLNKTVSLRDQDAWQPGSGFEVRYAKNLKGVTREVDTDLITRLYPFGQDGLTIASVNGGQLYIEDNHYTDTVYEGIFENQDLKTPEELLAAAQRALAEQSEPRTTYRVSLVDLSLLPAHAHETFDVGDIARVIDPELGVDIRARIVKYVYNVFQPWRASVEIGKPTESLASRIADGQKASRFVERVLRPNPGTNGLLKGFINTFATTINSANGKLVWDDSTLQAIEVDENGQETGKRVRITPGGVGISADGGQTFTTAMTGQGILANAVIVSDLYALASDDGYTQLKGDGLHVFDPAQQERVHVGRWMVDGLEHYGIRIFSNDGTVLLDDEGSLQTWEKGFPDNMDSTHPYRMEFYLPPETKVIKRVLLRFRRLKFRAYETGAKSGGGVTSDPSSSSTTEAQPATTSGASSTTTTGVYDFDTIETNPTNSTSWDISGAYSIGDIMSYKGSHDHGGAVSSDGGHAHGLVPHTHTIQIPNHSHGMNHTHQIPAHSHGMDHTHDIPSHTHSLVFGIYEGVLPSNITITVNGVDRTTALGGPFNSDQSGLDISAYLTVGAWNTIELGASGLGRLDASLFIQAKMGVVM